MEHVYDYLIVGAGMTADAAAKAIHEGDAKARIGIVGEEAQPPYERPPLSKVGRGSGRARSHESAVKGLRNGLRFRVNMKLLVDPADISIDGRTGNVQAVGDFLIQISARQQVQHYLFPRRKLLVGE